MSRYVWVVLCVLALVGLSGCRLHRAARAQGYAAIKGKMSIKEVTGALGLAGGVAPEKHHCGKCDVWNSGGYYYIKGYAAAGEETISRFSVFSNDGKVVPEAQWATADARLQHLHAPMRYGAVCSALGGKGLARTLMAYSWQTDEGAVTVEFENGKAYHKELVKPSGGKDEVDLCPDAPLWDK